MNRSMCFLLFAVAGGLLLTAFADDEVIFRSDVSLVRVDAQVLDRSNRAITGLQVTDFVLREEGQPQQIRNFASENMPVDVLLLLDVSASMRPHVQRISSAAHQAFQALGKDDRVGIMVFDRQSRLRLGFRNNRSEVEREFESLLRDETFNGGTDITRGLLDAASYIGREGRRDARRAIVILTDDQTEFNRDEEAVERALIKGDTVLSALIAPDAMANRQMQTGGGYPGGGWPSGGRRSGGGWPGGGWPGGGGGWPGTGGPVIIGPGGQGRRQGGPVMIGHRTKSAGTSEIAQASGGDSMPVSDASAFENTLSRIRQRYALHFYLPQGVKPGQERNIEVALADSARSRYAGAEVRYRRTYLAPGGGSGSSEPEPTVISRAPDQSSSADREAPPRRRAPRGDVSTGPRDGPLDVGGWRPAEGPAKPAPAAQPAPVQNAPADNQDQGGWRQIKPGERP
jgi:VWFA-related protein